MSFERVLACLLRSLCDGAPPSVYGDIRSYCPWGIKFDEGHAAVRALAGDPRMDGAVTRLFRYTSFGFGGGKRGTCHAR
jgi:hypothetical protein